MATDSRTTNHQEKMIIFGFFIIIVAVISVLTYRGYSQPKTEATALPEKAALSVTLGDTSLDKKIVVYTDPMCDKCGAYHTDTLKNIYKDYVLTKKLKLEIRPLSIVSERSAALTELLMCSNEQGKYWQMSDYVYAAVGRKNGRSADVNAVNFYTDFPAEKIAAAVQLDKDKLASCITASSYATKITQADTQAYAANIYSTPTTFIGDEDPVRGYAIYPYIKNIIDMKL